MNYKVPTWDSLAEWEAYLDNTVGKIEDLDSLVNDNISDTKDKIITNVKGLLFCDDDYLAEDIHTYDNNNEEEELDSLVFEWFN